jgi:lysozyme
VSWIGDEHDRIKAHEGLRLRAYDDFTGKELKRGDTLQGKLTIGYGRNLSDNGISEQEADALFHQDFHAALNEARQRIHFFDTLSDDRKGVMVNLIFNMGWPRLSLFKKFLRASAQRNYRAGAWELLDSKYARQVGQRAVDLADRWRGGKIKPENMA